MSSPLRVGIEESSIERDTIASARMSAQEGRVNARMVSSAGSSPVQTPRELRRSVTMHSPSGVGGGIFGVGGVSSPRKVASSVSTFKLANFVLGYLGSACLAKNDPSFQLSLDNSAQIVTFSSIEKEGVAARHYGRHLAAIHTVHTDPTDPKRISITFRDASRAGGVGTVLVKAYAMTLSEARMITELLRVMIDEYDESHPPTLDRALSSSAASDGRSAASAVLSERDIADTDIVYIGRVLKRGKMSWAPRWLVLKKFHLRVYKSNKLHVPSNNISLHGAKITINEEKDKHLTLICMDRSYTFKFCDVIERDNVMSLFQKSMELKQRPDGSLAITSINGVLPAPSKSARGSFFTPATSTRPSLIGDALLTRVRSQRLVTHATEDDDAESDDTERDGRRVLATDDGAQDSDPQPAPSGSSTPGQSSSGGGATTRFQVDSSSMPSDSISDLPPLSVKRRKSRRTISRDFQAILSKPLHALTIDEASNLYSSGGAARRKIEFAEFEINRQGYQRPSKNLHTGVYAMMQLLCESMTTGAHLSPMLYVPKSVWYQHGAKFQAFNVKLEVLETVRLQLLSILPPKAAEAVAELSMAEELERAWANFRIVAEEAQDKLAQHLSFIHTVKDPYRLRHKSGGATAAPTSASSESAVAPAAAASPASALTLGEKLSKSMKTFGKIVSRAASATKDKVDHEDSTRYVKLLHSIFDQSQVFREWYSYLSRPVEVGTNHARVLVDDAHRAVLADHLGKISEFFYCVLCNMVIRDLKSVLKRYSKHCVRTLAAH